jgi:O-antigen/teichoic acid export membrane protein
VTTPSEPEASPAHLQERAVRGSWWTLLNVVVSLPLGFVANLVVARALGVVDFGQLAVLALVIGIVAAVTDLGVGDTTVQFASQAEARGDPREAGRLLGSALGYRLLLPIPCLAVAVVAVLRDEPAWVVVVALLGTVAPQLLGGATQSFTAQSRMDTAARFGLVTNLLSQALGMLSALAVGTASAVWAARTGVSAAVAPAWLLALDPRRRREVLRPRAPWAVPAGWWPFALRTWAAGLLGIVVLSRSEVLVLQWLSTPAAVGLFALAAGVASQVAAPVAAIIGPLVPAAAGIVAVAPARISEAFGRVTRVAGVGTGLLVATAAPALSPLVGLLYGDDFAAAGPMLAAMIVAVGLSMLALPATAFLRARKRTAQLLGWTAVAAAVDVVLVLSLARPLGAWGAVVAFLGTGLVLASGLVVDELASEGLPRRRVVVVLLPLLLGSAAGAVGLAAGETVTSGVAASAVGAVLGASAYVLAVRLLRRGLTARDAEVAVAGLPSWLRRPAGAVSRVLVRP